MKLYDIILKKLGMSSDASASANVARDRLQIIVAHHKNNTFPENDQTVTKIKQDILKVLSKYYPSADFSNVNIQLEKDGEQAMLQIDLTIPESEVVT